MVNIILLEGNKTDARIIITSIQGNFRAMEKASNNPSRSLVDTYTQAQFLRAHFRQTKKQVSQVAWNTINTALPL